MPTLKSYAPSERAQQIIALARDALDGAEEVRTRIRRSYDAALECGRLLLKERDHVRKTLGHGAWESYYQITFSKTVPERTARHWMKQAKSAIAVLPSNSESSDLRNAGLTLGLFPPKQHTESANTGETHVVTPEIALPKHSTHLGIANRYSAWWTWFMNETKGEVSAEQAAQLLRDFEHIEKSFEWLHQRV